MHAPLRSAGLAAAASLSLLTSCADLTTVTLGPDDLAAIEHERRVDLDAVPLFGCVPGAFEVDDGSEGITTVLVSPEGAICRMTLVLDDVVLLDEAETRSASEQLADYDVDAVRAIRVQVEALEVSDAQGASVIDAPAVLGVELRMESTTLLTHEDLPIDPAMPIERTLPDEVRVRTIDAIEQGTALTADLHIDLLFDAANLASVPRTLGVRTVVQPIVDVDAVAAVL